MRKYNIGDIFEYIDRDDRNMQDIVALKITAKYNAPKKGGKQLYYRMQPIYEDWEPRSPNEWRWRRKSYEDGMSVSANKLAGLLRENKMRKMTEDRLALLLLKKMGENNENKQS